MTDGSNEWSIGILINTVESNNTINNLNKYVLSMLKDEADTVLPEATFRC